MSLLSQRATACIGFSVLIFSGVVTAQYDKVQDMESHDLFEAIAKAMPTQDASMYVHSAMKDIPKLTASLEPTIVALPRKESGRLDPTTVRYALHRLFVQQRAWFIQGLDPAGMAWNASSFPADVKLFKQMPVEVQNLITHRVDEGLEPHEVAILAATIEFILHNMAFNKLETAYKYLNFSVGASTQEQALQAIDLYMASYIVGVDIAKTPRSKMMHAFGKIAKVYPSWNETKKYIHTVAVPFAKADTGIVTITQARDIMEEIDEKFGRWQNYECLALKDQLVKMEDHNTGRVHLSDFYGKALGGNFHFRESLPYLRKNGALDESNPNNPRVIIPNYVNGLSNCIGASQYHSLCCISECEALLGAVEASLGKSEGSPDQIKEIVETLPSTTVIANRSLPELLMVRLSAIANDQSTGKVPIYGRLFAQWMHHAYPRECPFPHLSGSTKPTSIFQQVRDAKVKADFKAVASLEMMKRQTTKTPPRHDAPVEGAPWIHQEEFLFNTQNASPPAWLLLHSTTAVAAIITFALGICRMAGLGFRNTRLAKKQTAKSTLMPEHAFAV